MTAALTPSDRTATAEVTLKDDALICGISWFNETFRQLDDTVRIDWHCQDGDRLSADTVVCTLNGAARPILTGERTALNFLQTLSGTATEAAEFAARVTGTSATILDTRKTIPGLRAAQKYAVRCGGADNHRIGLFDAILIKENHIAAVGSIDAAIDKARETAGPMLVEVEVETLAQVKSALESHTDRLLLDNFTTDMMREAVELRNSIARDKTLEASGGITLDNVREIAETGVDYVSVGVMTKNVRAIDFSMRIV